jgi:predicted ester cyclase
MGVEENKLLVQQYIDTIFNERDVSRIAEFTTNEELQAGPPTLVAAFPDIQMKTEYLVGEGETVAIRMSATGTHQGNLEDFAPTGKPWEATATPGTSFVTTIVEFATNWDWLTIFEAIGAVSRTTPS